MTDASIDSRPRSDKTSEHPDASEPGAERPAREKLQRAKLHVPPPGAEPPPRKRKPKAAASSNPIIWLAPRSLAHALLSRDAKCGLDWRHDGYSVRAMLPGNDDVTLLLPYDAADRWRHAPRGVDMQVLSAVATRLRKHGVAEFASLSELADLAGCHRNRVRDSLDYWNRLALIIADDYEPANRKAKQPGRSVTRELPPYIEHWQVIGQRLRITVSAKWTQLARRYFMPIELPLPTSAAAQNALLLIHTWLVSPPPRKDPDAVRKKKFRQRFLQARLGIAPRGNAYVRQRLIAALTEVARRLPGRLGGKPKEGETVWVLRYYPNKPRKPAADAQAAKPQAEAAAKPKAERAAPWAAEWPINNGKPPPSHRMDDPANAALRAQLYGFVKRFSNQAAIDLIVMHGDDLGKAETFYSVRNQVGGGHRIHHYIDAYEAACEQVQNGATKAHEQAA